MPLFVKPLRADASIGIGTDSLVHDATALMKRVAAIHKKFNDSALAEEYIEGREFYVGVLGNRDPVAFPPIEMDFSGLPDGRPAVLDSKAKWEKNSAEYKGTKSVIADIPDELRAQLQKVSLEAYRAPAGPRLRPGRPPADRDGRDLRDRGQRQLLPGEVGRVRRRRRAARGSATTS